MTEIKKYELPRTYSGDGYAYQARLAPAVVGNRLTSVLSFTRTGMPYFG
jgi:hypothetical protein